MAEDEEPIREGTLNEGLGKSADYPNADTLFDQLSDLATDGGDSGSDTSGASSSDGDAGGDE